MRASDARQPAILSESEPVVTDRIGHGLGLTGILMPALVFPGQVELPPAHLRRMEVEITTVRWQFLRAAQSQLTRYLSRNQYTKTFWNKNRRRL